MNSLHSLLQQAIVAAIKALYSSDVEPSSITFQETRKEFDGDITLVVFPYTRLSKVSPEATADAMGKYLAEHSELVKNYNVVKGFLNIVIEDRFWLDFLKSLENNNAFGEAPASGHTMMVEYSSPNTNKPLHLGHVRNNLLGYSVAQILKANGHKVIKTNLVNDRGIHICKSMLAWQKFGNGETPASSGMKGDKLVGKYYVEFDKANQSAGLAHLKSTVSKASSKDADGNIQYVDAAKPQSAKLNLLIAKAAELLPQQATASFKEIAKQVSDKEDEVELFKDYFLLNNPLMDEAREMLRQWEAGNPGVVELWKTMNGWVYAGFEISYKKLGVDFDKIYYESETYLLGKKLVDEGLQSNVFFKKPDGSVWIDLSNDGLDQKLVLRGDGTSVYITQDLGTAQERFEQYGMDHLVYVVGNEQDYHFKVLKLIMQKMGRNWANGIEHLSYGMVELPAGKMKSREGTVVDADDLVEEMIDTARQMTEELGKTEGLAKDKADELYSQIGMGALKYFILKVDPKKKMLFNPQESIDFNGNTGPFIQYTHARICSILRKAAEKGITADVSNKKELLDKEKELVKTLYQFPAEVRKAGEERSPSVVANYVYDLAKTFNQFYHDLSILNEPDEASRQFRLSLAATVAKVIERSLKMLGIAAPQQM